MLEAVLPPLISAYTVFVLMVLSARRRPPTRPPSGSGWLGPRRRGMVRHLVGTTAGGYAVFLAIVAVFHAWLGAEPGALASALLEGTLLALAVFGLFAGLVWLSPPRHLRGRGSGARDDPGPAGDAGSLTG
jgi:hypothetical protein